MGRLAILLTGNGTGELARVAPYWDVWKGCRPGGGHITPIGNAIGGGAP
jgi:hypothetical protein